LCSQLSKLINSNKAPAGAVPPQPIQRDGLFQLDVDDDIWQDVGLDDDQDGPVPRWLGDDRVREGIRALLEFDRCQEEEARLGQERCAMQVWLKEEWLCIEEARRIACVSLFFQFLPLIITN